MPFTYRAFVLLMIGSILYILKTIDQYLFNKDIISTDMVSNKASFLPFVAQNKHGKTPHLNFFWIRLLNKNLWGKKYFQLLSICLLYSLVTCVILNFQTIGRRKICTTVLYNEIIWFIYILFCFVIFSLSTWKRLKTTF